MRRFLIYLAVSTAACATRHPSRPARADVILQWNEQVIASGGPHVQRTLAMVHLAMFDAVNAITPKYEPYLTLPAPPAPASIEAAAAGAAYGVLTRLFPDERPTFAAALDRSLSSLADGEAKSSGARYGDLVGQQIAAARLSDNMLADETSVPTGSKPGEYQLTDAAPAQPINSNASRWVPFALESASQFRPDPPPALTSGRYARDFDEVHRLGGTSSVRRSSDQEARARWHTEPAATQLNRIARTEAAFDGRDLPDHARLFALLNLALADATTSAFDAAYAFRAWRPITAIRAADRDDNPKTEPDLVWSPLLSTPPHPAYPSPRAVVQWAGARVLAALFGRAHRFQTTSTVMPGVSHSYRDFDAFADESGEAEVVGGVHFRSAVEQGMQTGSEIAAWILNRCLRPLDRARDLNVHCHVKTPVSDSVSDEVGEGATPSPASSRASRFRARPEAPRPFPGR